MRTLSLFMLALFTASAAAQQPLSITVTGGKKNEVNVPVCVPLQLSKANAEKVVLGLEGDGVNVIGQLTPPGLVTSSIVVKEGVQRKDLHFVLPQLKAGQTLTLKESAQAPKTSGRFKFEAPSPNMKSATLAWEESGQKPRVILRCMDAAYDDSTKESRNLTYKVFHHLYAPDGSRFVTNGGPTGLFPHHRGLMFGFNKVTYDGNKKADTWHCPAPVFVEATKTETVAGPVLGRQLVFIDWHGDKKTVFAKEQRELTVYKIPGGTLVEFASKLETTGGPVKLDGDPQHAGFQFRADKEVAEKSAKQTYYLRPDGKGKLGETRNWEPKSKKGPVNLPWNAMSFVLGDKRYTVAYIDHPRNPGERRYSERDYGRFGCYFEYEVTKENPLLVNYRVWLQDGEMTGAQVEALLEPFIHPPQVKVN